MILFTGFTGTRVGTCTFHGTTMSANVLKALHHIIISDYHNHPKYTAINVQKHAYFSKCWFWNCIPNPVWARLFFLQVYSKLWCKLNPCQRVCASIIWIVPLGTWARHRSRGRPGKSLWHNTCKHCDGNGFDSEEWRCEQKKKRWQTCG